MVFKSLRDGLAGRGISVKWLGVGPNAQAAFNDPKWEGQRSSGAVVAGDVEDEQTQARLLKDFLEGGGAEGIFVNVLAGRVETNLVRYLSPVIRRVMIVHSISPGTYAAAASIRDYVHAVVCVSPRIMRDLTRRMSFCIDRTFVIPNAIDITPYRSIQRHSTDAPLRLLSLGRIVDADKGVYWLQDVMRQLNEFDVSLTVAGDGPDLPELGKRLARFQERVSFIGRVSPVDVPRVFADHDVFLFPSRFEGLGIALVEAMAAGCVPVSSRIKGVTDYVLEHGESGFLFEVGDMKKAAGFIKQLAVDRELLAKTSQSARETSLGRFTLSRMSEAYASVVDMATSSSHGLSPMLSMSQWRYPAGLKNGWRSYLPAGIKNKLRVWRERFSL